MDTLDGVHGKINRARVSLWDLEADIAAFCEFERRQIVFEHQQHVLRWIDDTPKVPADYSIRIGEIAYNLRSALDHLVWQLVLVNGACPSTNNAFPIYQDEEKYKKHATRKLKRVAPIHCDLIEEFQTYHGQRGVGAHLWMLDIICNIDRHRRLNIVDLHSMTETYKEKIEPIIDVCFRDKEVEDASMGYGSDIETIGMSRPPVARVLSACLTAVNTVVDQLSKVEKLS